MSAKTGPKTNIKWVRLNRELREAVEDEQILLSRAVPGVVISFSAAMKSLIICGIEARRVKR